MLDHCGIPQVRERQFDPWRQQIHDISKCPNVVCKISGLVAYAEGDGQAARDALNYYLKHGHNISDRRFINNTLGRINP